MDYSALAALKSAYQDRDFLPFVYSAYWNDLRTADGPVKRTISIDTGYDFIWCRTSYMLRRNDGAEPSWSLPVEIKLRTSKNDATMISAPTLLCNGFAGTNWRPSVMDVPLVLSGPETVEISLENLASLNANIYFAMLGVRVSTL